MQLIIFTDLDGTLIDSSTYSWKKAAKALSLIKRKKVPLIFCSSKTRAELELLRKRIGNRDPFTTENGGGIFIPKNYFNFKFDYSYKKDGYYAIELGRNYKYLREKLDEIKKETGFRIVGFKDMSAKKLSNSSGLGITEAKLAKKRDFTEPYILAGNAKKVEKLTKKKGLSYTKGSRYHYIMGDNDKGKAARILIRLYKKKFGSVVSVGLGDSLNDLPMLKKVDKAFIVQMPNKSYDKSLIKYKQIKKIKGIGPEGWNKAVLSLVPKPL